jgi:hypothetical protein
VSFSERLKQIEKMIEEQKKLNASQYSAFWASGWSRLLEKKLKEHRSSGSGADFQCDPIPYRAGAAGARCANERSKRRVAILNGK